MFFTLTRSFWLGVRTLSHHKLRSLLTILGVVFGVASVIIMLAVGEGARAEALAAISDLGATNIILRSVKPSEGASDGISTGAIRYGLNQRNLRRLTAALSEDTVFSPIRHHRRRVRYRNRELECRIVGVEPNYQVLNDLKLQDGRFIQVMDGSRALPVAVLGAGVTETLFPLEECLGKSIRIGNDRYFQVIGIAAPRDSTQGARGGLPAQNYGVDIYIPFNTDRQRFGENVTFDPNGSLPPEKVEISQLTIGMPSTGQVRSAAQLARSILLQNGRDDETVVTVPLDLIVKTEQTQRVFTLVLTCIASISLLVGGIGIMNIMLATVTERTREIGIRRALGARRANIVSQFLIETIVLSGTGGVLGLLLGVGGAAAAQAVGDVPTIVRPWAPLLAISISLLVGVVFGLYPARRAAYMDPIQALRHE